MDPVYQYLVTILTEKFEAPPERIHPQATLDDLDLDSLAVVELYLTLQEHWAVPLDDTGATAALTVEQVARAVTDLLEPAVPELFDPELFNPERSAAP